MSTLTDSKPVVSTLAITGFLLVARRYLVELELTCPTGAQVLARTGVSKSRAYELGDRIVNLLSEVVRPVGGRPRRENSPKRDADGLSEISYAVIRYLMEHPGCVCRRLRRHRYSDGFRLHVIKLRERFSEIDLQAFADASQVPLGTIEDWLRTPIEGPAGDNADGHSSQADEAKDAKIQSILYAWRSWRGDFTNFCHHVRDHLRLNFGNTMIASVLGFFGERKPRSRRGRSPDEEATRSSFETFFPGAEWIGDGKEVTIWIDGEKISCNFELMVDAYTGAFVGTSIRDSEDSEAVIEAFEGGVATTGEKPLAVLLDNRPPNHTDAVVNKLGETLLIPSTPGRGQSKAHVEGGFGLFSQNMPLLCVSTGTKKELGKQIVGLMAHIFCRILNQKPRRDRKGKSRVELYTQKGVTEDDREKALEALRQRLQKQKQARKTREARIDPTLRNLLEKTFSRLELIDPKHHIRNSIARYPLDDIVDGIAIFEGKREKKTLPEGADGRYLLGIIRNVYHVHESDAITDALLQERLNARDLFLQPLAAERDTLLQEHDQDAALNTIVKKALIEDRALDRLFWTDTLTRLTLNKPEDERPEIFKGVARRIHAIFSVPTKLRDETERRLIRKIWPLS